MKLWTAGLLLYLSIAAVCSLLFDEEVEIMHGFYAKMPVVVRHVEFIGTADNGTLDCFIPGFSEYRWELINKASSGPYAESSTLILDDDIKEHHSKIKIGNGGIPMVTEMLVVSCKLMLNKRPKFQIIWVVTRLHSPLGYPTDPRICTFNRNRYYSVSCDHYYWKFNTDCYHGYGTDYKGDAFTTTSNPPGNCQYWFQNNPNPGSDKYKVDMNKEHRFCRNPSIAHGYSPWCITTSGSSALRKQSCRVQECSDCMYGNGNGDFDLYHDVQPISKWTRKLPEYNGRTIVTLKKDSDGNPRMCLTGTGFPRNRCKPRKGGKPVCVIAKYKKDEPNIKSVFGPEPIETVECRIPQCTVRQVWFLFFSSNGDPYLKESNLEAVEIVLIHGRHMYFKFGAFGIHLTTGLSVSSDDPRLAKFAVKFKLVARAPPDKLSTIAIYHLRKEMSGNYFVQYTFVEADTRIQRSTYKGNFKLDVRHPMSLSLEPSVVELCKGQKGSLSIQVSGGFAVHEESLKWKYGSSKNKMNQEISVDDPAFELSTDLKTLIVKEMQKDTWVGVEGSSYSGKANGTGQFKLKAQPRLVGKSPSQVFALPGDEISLLVETEKGLKTRWTYDAQLIPEVPDDPDMAFERGLEKSILSETLVISPLDWRHYGTYVVETEKDGCQEAITFKIDHDKERALSEELNSTSVDDQEIGELGVGGPVVTKSGKCDVKQLKLVTHDKRNYATNWTIEVPCYSKEEKGVKTHDHGVEELSPCSVLTGYTFTATRNRQYKLLISTNETRDMAEFNGEVNMKSTYIESNNDEAWIYHYYFSEPIPARFAQFAADKVEDSRCLYGLTLSGCTLVKSKCKPKTFTSDDIVCGDRKSSLLNKEEVRKLSSCSLITSYQFASNESRGHKLMISGQNSMLLTEYGGNMEVEVQYSGREWLFHNSLDEPAPARYVQFVPSDKDDGPLRMYKLQITGCRLDKHLCALDWSTFREVGLKCDEDQLTPIYSEHPVLELPSCSLIASYQFIGKTAKHQALLISGNNPALLRNFQEGAKIESFYYKGNEWVFVCSFAAPIAAQYVQFVCDTTGNETCADKLAVSGCAIEESWCEEQSFETKIEEYYIRTNFFHSSLGKALLKATIASFLTPIWMFIVGRYNLDGRLIKFLMRCLRRFTRTSGPKKPMSKTE